MDAFVAMRAVEGEKLKEDAVLVPKKMGCCVCLEKEDADELYRLLHKVLGVLGKE